MCNCTELGVECVHAMSTERLVWELEGTLLDEGWGDGEGPRRHLAELVARMKSAMEEGRRAGLEEAASAVEYSAKRPDDFDLARGIRSLVSGTKREDPMSTACAEVQAFLSGNGGGEW